MSYIGNVPVSKKIDATEIPEGTIIASDIATAPTFPNAVVASNMAHQFAFKNRVLNGNFDFWQRAASQTTTGYGSADRWRLRVSGSSTTMSQQSFIAGQTEVPNEPAFYMRNVIVSSAGANNYVANQYVLGSARILAGKPVTMTFWAKANAAKNIAVEWSRYTGTGDGGGITTTGIGATKFTLSTAWQKITMTLTLPTLSSVSSAEDDTISFNIWYDAGSGLTARTATLGQQSGTFDIAQVQVEEGTVATPFEMKPIAIELMLIQQYYQKITFTKSPCMLNANRIISPEGARIYFPVPMVGTPVATQSNAGWASCYVMGGVTPPDGEFGSQTSKTDTIYPALINITSGSLGIGLDAMTGWEVFFSWACGTTKTLTLEVELIGA
jgi:hypothetical protein